MSSPTRRALSALGRLLIVVIIGCVFGLAKPALLAVAFVNTETGNYAYAFADIRQQDDPFFTFTRSYNSLDSRRGPMGPGWTHNFNVRLVPDSYPAPDTWAFVGPDGRTERHTLRSDGRFHLAGVQGGVLVRHQEGPFAGTWELSEPDGTRYELRADGRPSRITYPNQSVVLLTYDEVGHLVRVADPNGKRRLTFTHEQQTDRLVSVRDWLDPPREVGFGYDDLGRLAIVTDRRGFSTHYSYDGTTQRLREMVNGRGNTTLRHEYDADGRVVKQWTARGVASDWPTTFAYGRDPRSGSYPPNGYTTTMTYPSSGFAPTEPTVVVHAYDGQGRLIRRESRPAPGDEPLIEEQRWDPMWNRTVQPVMGGRTSSEIGPPSGDRCIDTMRLPGLESVVQVGRAFQVSQSTPPMPAALLSVRQRFDGQPRRIPRYDEVGRLTEFTLDRRNGPGTEAWSLTFDNEDHIVEITGRSGDGESLGTSEFSYDEVGNLVEQRAADGARTHYGYDERDNLIAVHQDGGQTAQYEYDERGFLSKLTTTSVDSADAHVVEYQHDGLGRLRRIVDHASINGTPVLVTTDLNYQQMTLVAICQR